MGISLIAVVRAVMAAILAALVRVAVAAVLHSVMQLAVMARMPSKLPPAPVAWELVRVAMAVLLIQVDSTARLLAVAVAVIAQKLRQRWVAMARMGVSLFVTKYLPIIRVVRR